jgi:endonuclease G, mitochondrial
MTAEQLHNHETSDAVAVASQGPPPDRTTPAERFAGRVGYRADFLATPVPLPTIKTKPKHGGALRIPRPTVAASPTLLQYTHYSVILNRRRRLAYLAAANVDFGAPFQANSPGSDKWRLDGRVDAAQQLGNLYYHGPANLYDRGHLARRDDVAWGATMAEAEQANLDSFHFPNCAPQHRDFNQSGRSAGRQLLLWGELENHISRQGGAQRARLSIFNGPIFTATDKPLKDIFVPRAFFKIVVWQDAGQQPAAAGFVLEQDDLIVDLPVEGIDPGPFRLRQKRITAIQLATDLMFGPIRGFDRFRAPVPTESAGADFNRDGIEIDSFDDLSL